jgi:hypothetical protein
MNSACRADSCAAAGRQGRLGFPGASPHKAPPTPPSTPSRRGRTPLAMSRRADPERIFAAWRTGIRNRPTGSEWTRRPRNGSAMRGRSRQPGVGYPAMTRIGRGRGMGRGGEGRQTAAGGHGHAPTVAGEQVFQMQRSGVHGLPSRRSIALARINSSQRASIHAASASRDRPSGVLTNSSPQAISSAWIRATDRVPASGFGKGI